MKKLRHQWAGMPGAVGAAAADPPQLVMQPLYTKTTNRSLYS